MILALQLLVVLALVAALVVLVTFEVIAARRIARFIRNRGGLARWWQTPPPPLRDEMAAARECWHDTLRILRLAR